MFEIIKVPQNIDLGISQLFSLIGPLLINFGPLQMSYVA